MDAPKDYLDFIGSVKDRIRNTQYVALKAFNKESWLGFIGILGE